MFSDRIIKPGTKVLTSVPGKYLRRICRLFGSFLSGSFFSGSFLCGCFNLFSGGYYFFFNYFNSRSFFSFLVLLGLVAT